MNLKEVIGKVPQDDIYYELTLYKYSLNCIELFNFPGKSLVEIKISFFKTDLGWVDVINQV